MPDELDTDAVIFSSVDWDAAWQAHQEVSVRLAARGARVLFVENTTVRGPQRGDLGRVLHRLRRWWRQERTATRATRGLPAGIEVFSPLVAPYPWQAWSQALNRVIFVPKIRALARDLRDPMIWSFLPSPTVVEAIKACRKPGSATIYYCAADFTQVADDARALRDSEAELLALADIVFVVGSRLRERFVANHPEVHVYPFGVDTDLFARAIGPEPPDLVAIPRPRVGYVGSLHRHLLLGWLAEAAHRLPHVSFIFIGPPHTDLKQLTSLRNVHLLGRRSHEVVPAYLNGLDVCLVPYSITPYTESGIPTKLFEYLAAGKPVVASEMPEIRALALPDGAVAFARDADEFVGKIAEQLASGSAPEAERARESFAARYSWDVIFPAMLRHVARVSRARTAAAS